MLRPWSEREEGVWVVALRLDELWEGELVGLRLGDADVLLVNLGQGDIHAYDNHCPHAGSPLSEGRLSATTLVCATHLWEFDARTGRGINPTRCQLRRYPVKIVDGVVMVQVGRPRGQ